MRGSSRDFGCVYFWDSFWFVDLLSTKYRINIGLNIILLLGLRFRHAYPSCGGSPIFTGVHLLLRIIRQVGIPTRTALIIIDGIFINIVGGLRHVFIYFINEREIFSGIFTHPPSDLFFLLIFLTASRHFFLKYVIFWKYNSLEILLVYD